MKTPPRFLAATLALLQLVGPLAAASSDAPGSFAEAVRSFKQAPPEAREQAALSLAAWAYHGPGEEGYHARLEVLAGEMQDPESQASLAPVAQALEAIWSKDQPGLRGSRAYQRLADLTEGTIYGAATGGVVAAVVTVFMVAGGMTLMAMLPVVATLVGVGAVLGFLYSGGKLLFDWPFYREHRGTTRPSSVIPTHAASMRETIRSRRPPPGGHHDQDGGSCTPYNGAPTLDCLEVRARPR
jgi:hypothetical protein